MPAYTRRPSADTARGRGLSPNSVTTRSALPPGCSSRAVASITQTSARPTLGWFMAGSTGLFWPRWAVVMNARSRLAPAKTMSRGSSPTQIVCTTCGTAALTSTTLTLSDRWFTTHARPAGPIATAMGSRPTRTDATDDNPSAVVNISSRLSAYSQRTDADRPATRQAAAPGRTRMQQKTVGQPWGGGRAESYRESG